MSKILSSGRHFDKRKLLLPSAFHVYITYFSKVAIYCILQGPPFQNTVSPTFLSINPNVKLICFEWIGICMQISQILLKI